MCECQNRRHFLSLMTASLLLPSMARAQDNAAIRTLSGKLDTSFFKAKTAALIAARSAKTTFVIGQDTHIIWRGIGCF